MLAKLKAYLRTRPQPRPLNTAWSPPASLLRLSPSWTALGRSSRRRSVRYRHSWNRLLRHASLRHS